jgi:hypothetical protein
MRLSALFGFWGVSTFKMAFLHFVESRPAMINARHAWGNSPPLLQESFECPHCGTVGTPLVIATSSQVLDATRPLALAPTRIYACPKCTYPTIYILSEERYLPAQRYGKPINNLPKDIAALYDEASSATAAGAYTACAMVARKILMNLAVLEGAKENLSFAAYVTYLAENGFVPPKGRGWVDRIRSIGNEANHEIQLIDSSVAKDLMYLVEMLLRFNFEMIDPAPLP